ncbi:MAG: molybdopterin converting factor subunit 1 [Nitrospinaceae bacterium]|jgi:molybdopterin converting factor subunit 1|nr:MAG: molybdopterin converting factor subunit 1 [Nitrospinaceae bacterium]
MTRLLYFASLRALAGKSEESLELGGETTVRALGERIGKTSPKLGEMILGKKVMVSVNQDVATLDTPVRDGDEVAFLPPFSGGAI